MEMDNLLPQILLLSHGEMCQGVCDSVRMLTGEADCIKALSLREGQDPMEYMQQIKETYAAMPEGSIILMDIMNGTPANSVVMLGRDMKVYALAGFSLATVVSAVYERRNCAGQELIDRIEQDTKDGVTNLGPLFAQLRGE